MPVDAYAYNAAGDAPARGAFLITPSDGTALVIVPRAIRADSAGAVKVTPANGAADVTFNMAAGELIPLQVTFVKATGTTVATLHGFI